MNENKVMTLDIFINYNPSVSQLYTKLLNVYPKEHLPEIDRRLNQPDYHGPLHELWTYAYLLEKGLQPEVVARRNLESIRTPDFKCLYNGLTFYAEATVISEIIEDEQGKFKGDPYCERTEFNKACWTDTKKPFNIRLRDKIQKYPSQYLPILPVIRINGGADYDELLDWLHDIWSSPESVNCLGIIEFATFWPIAPGISPTLWINSRSNFKNFSLPGFDASHYHVVQ
jgi:hypothetical protein